MQGMKRRESRISKLKAVNGSSSFIEQSNLSKWSNLKNSKFRNHRYSADEPLKFI
jgi:hypothetical protein